MSSLSEQQQAFGAALLSGPEAAFLARFAEAPALAEKRFAAYRRNVLGNWRGALEATYPVLATLVGPAAFRALADAYLTQFPSRNGDLNVFGDRFPSTLEGTEIAARLPWLCDLAALEWALEVVYSAPGEAPLDFDRLNAVPVDRQGDVVLVLAGQLRRIVTDWPLCEIWQAHQRDSVAARDLALEKITLLPQRHAIVVYRNPAGSAVPIRLSPGEAAFFDACQAACGLDEAFHRALAVAPELDVAGLLPNWLARGWLVDLALPGQI